MDIQINKFPSYYILNIIGKLDFLSSFQFKELINTLINENVKNVIINFQNLSFIDSSGIGALITINVLFDSYDKNLWLVNFQGEAEKTLNSTKLNKQFPITTLDNAISIIKSDSN